MRAPARCEARNPRPPARNGNAPPTPGSPRRPRPPSSDDRRGRVVSGRGRGERRFRRLGQADSRAVDSTAVLASDARIGVAGAGASAAIVARIGSGTPMRRSISLRSERFASARSRARSPFRARRRAPIELESSSKNRWIPRVFLAVASRLVPTEPASAGGEFRVVGPHEEVQSSRPREPPKNKNG